MFRVTNMSNQTSIKYPGATTSISKVHINNMYIKYTFVHLAILLIHQILGAVPLPVTIPLAVEALSFRLRSSFGFLPFETSGLVNHQHLMLLLDFYLRSFEHCEDLGNSIFHSLHIIVHHEAFIAWWK